MAMGKAVESGSASEAVLRKVRREKEAVSMSDDLD
jgi:hypothetical protein